MRPIEEAKQRLPLPLLMRQLGLGERAKKSARCPFHHDRNPSFSVFQIDGSWFYKCHACGATGDEINFLEKHNSISPSDATKLYLEMADVAHAHATQTPGRKSSRGHSEPFDWQRCVDAFTEKHIERLAEWRGYSREFCAWLKHSGLVGLHEGHIAFPVRDGAGSVIAAHYRQKDGSWRYYPQGAKVRPLAIGELVAGEPVHVFESQWDCFAFLDVSGERSGVIATRGAGNGALVSKLSPERSILYCWTQNDAAGEKWQRDICVNTKAIVKQVRIPATHKDLNDWLIAGAQPADLVAAITNAEVLKQVEKSWADALNESVVTSNELHNLKLKPRKKLLGDWFCEGDLGFIFAFRGVGKTWLALGIARALSEGGKIGDWQAHEHVKVLYIDGEMPPDLMRDRCDGLERSSGELEFLNHEILFERAGKVLNITNPEIQQAITERCIKTGAKVVILDNLSTLASGMRENEADSWELVNNWFLDLRRRKIAVVIVHHAGRSGEMRGTSKREDNVFWIIALDDGEKNSDDKRGARFISRFTKPSRNTQEEVPTYEWHFVTDEATGVVSVGHKQAQTMDVFLQLIADGVTECGQIAQEMKVSPATVSRLAKQAFDAGRIKKVNREYMLTEGT
jgi:putative DNA primase/helicase